MSLIPEAIILFQELKCRAHLASFSPRAESGLGVFISASQQASVQARSTMEGQIKLNQIHFHNPQIRLKEIQGETQLWLKIF